MSGSATVAASASGASATVPPAAPSPPTGGAVAAMGDEVRLWCSSLPIARVTRWGGMISTPDAVLQVRIRNYGWCRNGGPAFHSILRGETFHIFEAPRPVGICIV